MKANLIITLCLSLGMNLFNSCKKPSEGDNTPASLNAAGLNSGRAGIRVTTIEYFKDSKSFEVSNSDNTSAIINPANGNTTIAEIDLEATEMKNSFLNRKVSISILVFNTASTANGPITIDLSVQSGTPPMAFIHLEKYDNYLGFTEWQVTSGTLTITKLTATEIEGAFTGIAVTNSSLSNALTISNGLFAGKF